MGRDFTENSASPIDQSLRAAGHGRSDALMTALGLFIVISFAVALADAPSTPPAKSAAETAATATPAAAPTFTRTATRDLPIPFPARNADPAGATLVSDPIPGVIPGAILQSRPTPRRTPIGFTKFVIPDPDDRANTPTAPVAPDLLPIIPAPPPSK